MSTNYKSMYKALKQQIDTLRNVKSGTTPTIGKDFNQKGWEQTISLVEVMLEKMKEANASKGKRMTPQFFRAIFNRAVNAIEELDKAAESKKLEGTDFDYEKACKEMSQEIADLLKETSNEEDGGDVE